MSDSSDDPVKRAVQGTIDDDPGGIVHDLRASHVAFVAWVVAAGLYGFSVAQWGNAAVDMESASPYPEYAWVFLTLGLAVGVGMSASIIATKSGDSDE